MTLEDVGERYRGWWREVEGQGLEAVFAVDRVHEEAVAWIVSYGDDFLARMKVRIGAQPFRAQ